MLTPAKWCQKSRTKSKGRNEKDKSSDVMFTILPGEEFRAGLHNEQTESKMRKPLNTAAFCILIPFISICALLFEQNLTSQYYERCHVIGTEVNRQLPTKAKTTAL